MRCLLLRLLFSRCSSTVFRAVVFVLTSSTRRVFIGCLFRVVMFYWCWVSFCSVVVVLRLCVMVIKVCLVV